MKQSVLLILLLTLSCYSYGNGDVNYKHKAIQKTLVKSCKLLNPQLSEITLPEELSVATEGKFFNVESDADTEIKHVYIGRVNSCRAGGCSIADDAMLGASEYFDYMVLFNDACNVVLVKVFNYQASHGHEVTAKGWLKQFIGYSVEDNLEVGKNIDSISGATISVNGITNDVEEKTSLLKEVVQAEAKIATTL
ncbi:FMN-binding protein [Marinilabiliaceae bacterium N1Y90]|nr:FMN-binding protein [Marinilabiliaceae bacterium N1Y90]